jgi:1-deoxy-D-xylulose-5-phosphate reductoisomerase
LNASNEIAVQAFLDGKIGFRAIDQLIALCMDKIAVTPVTDLDGILAVDAEARAVAIRL